MSVGELIRQQSSPRGDSGSTPEEYESDHYGLPLTVYYGYLSATGKSCMSPSDVQKAIAGQYSIQDR